MHVNKVIQHDRQSNIHKTFDSLEAQLKIALPPDNVNTYLAMRHLEQVQAYADAAIKESNNAE